MLDHPNYRATKAKLSHVNSWHTFCRHFDYQNFSPLSLRFTYVLLLDTLVKVITLSKPRKREKENEQPNRKVLHRFLDSHNHSNCHMC
jgi:hypothetical protein